MTLIQANQLREVELCQSPIEFYPSNWIFQKLLHERAEEALRTNLQFGF